ncbi:2OG-Fe dioxygenase family protein [Pseudomonas putida]|uniref:2OG-Fe dioxygenase family protein n=1 Tax=Pseudomonas putida TaxID=303 RepID=UPI002365A751|nr:2OG-Fe dioxygenase family protein [Pseudomonas putida]MDD2050361.1 2OG-Fe dioxygenase family protein [Pseudomonas putida]
MSSNGAIRYSDESALYELSESLSNCLYASSTCYPAALVAQLGNETCRAFNATWNTLRPDIYLGAANGTRQRRICKFEYRHKDRRWKTLESCNFFQPPAHNPLLGGIERTYARSETSFIGSPVLQTLLAADLALLELTVGQRDWLVTCHQFRVLCDEHNEGQATPEGRHRDGHDFVFQHLIQRQSVIGGESRVFDENGETVFRATLTDYMETVVLNDRTLLHEVSPLQPHPDGSTPGTRDMLIIDFDLAGD